MAAKYIKSDSYFSTINCKKFRYTDAKYCVGCYVLSSESN